MAEDMIELALEGLDRATDKYYDVVHDGVRHGYTTTIGPWIKKRGVWRKRATSEPAKPAEQDKLNAQADKLDAQREGDKSDSEDNRGKSAGRYDERRERVLDNGQDYSPPYRPDYAWNSNNPQGYPSAAYPPAPQINLPPGDTPYPSNEQMIPMPVTGAAYQALDYRGAPPIDEFYRDHSRRYNADLERGGRRGRARSAYSPSRSRSNSRRRNRSSGHREKSRHSQGRDDKVRDHKSGHLTASLAGAVAGAYIGQKAGKGDMMATLAGVVVGAIGANVAERGLERHQSKKEKKEEKDWDRKYGREEKSSRY